MSLFGVQLRNERTAALGWSFGLFLFTAMIGASYTIIEEDTQQWDELLESFGGVEEAFGVDSFTTPDGYLKGQAVALYPLLLGIYGGLAATKALAGAQESGRLDHMLARPVSRTHYLLVASAALATVVLGIVLAAALGAIIGYAIADQSGEIIAKSFLMVLEVLPLCLALLGLGILAGTLFQRRGPANAAIMGVVVGGFAIDILGKLVDDLSWLEYITPYGWWGRSDVFNGAFDWPYLIVSILILGMALAGAVLRFETKDL